MDRLTCKRCGNKWIARTDNPKQCPGCKSLSWNKEKKTNGNGTN